MRAMVTTNDTGGWKILLVPESDTERRMLDRAMSEFAPAREDYSKVEAAINVQTRFSAGRARVGVTLIKTPLPVIKMGSRLKEVAVTRDFKMDAANDREDGD